MAETKKHLSEEHKQKISESLRKRQLRRLSQPEDGEEEEEEGRRRKKKGFLALERVEHVIRITMLAPAEKAMVVRAFGRELKQQDPKFDYDPFAVACGIKSKEEGLYENLPVEARRTGQRSSQGGEY